jgi:hypothetical protein
MSKYITTDKVKLGDIVIHPNGVVARVLDKYVNEQGRDEIEFVPVIDYTDRFDIPILMPNSTLNPNYLPED